jgi:hypothetical protein
MAMVLARWESKNGKHWAELCVNSDGTYSYRAADCGGNLGYVGVVQAFERMREKVDSGYFLPDVYKTVMQRVL